MSWKPVLATETFGVQKVYFPHGLLVWLHSHRISILCSAITLAIIMVHLKQGGLSFRTIENAWQRSQGEGRKALKRRTSNDFNSNFTFRAILALNKDDEFLATTSEVMLYAAMVHLMFRRLKPKIQAG